MIDERRMNDVGTNTLDVVVEPNRDRLRTSTMEANAQTSIPIVDVLCYLLAGGSFNDTPSGRGNNLSITGYEPDLTETLLSRVMRSPSMWAQEISIMPQLDGLGSLPMRDPIGRRTQEISRPAE